MEYRTKEIEPYYFKNEQGIFIFYIWYGAEYGVLNYCVANENIYFFEDKDYEEVIRP